MLFVLFALLTQNLFCDKLFLVDAAELNFKQRVYRTTTRFVLLCDKRQQRASLIINYSFKMLPNGNYL